MLAVGLEGGCWSAGGGWWLLEEVVDELGTGGGAEFAVGAAQMELDRLGTQEQRGGDVAVGLAVGDQPGHLELLGGEATGGRLGAAAGDLPGGLELGPGLVGPGTGVQLLEGGQRSPKAISSR
jgi:hypothetical protein